jgi:hypothetical protein
LATQTLTTLIGLELETALATAINEVSSFLTPQIITGGRNKVFHFEWDNLNKVTTNVHGSYIVNSTGGIMIQELKPGFTSTPEQTLPLYDRAKSRSLEVDTPETLPPIGPKFPGGAVFTPPVENDKVYEACLMEYRVWFLARMIGSSGKQPVPAFGGFVSVTGMKPTRKSIYD